LLSGSFLDFSLFAEKTQAAISSPSEIHPNLAFGFSTLTCSFTDETDDDDLRHSFKILV